jgi:ATP-binding cassette subfamily C protein
LTANQLRALFGLMTPGERGRLVGLLFAIVTMGLLQVAGVGSLIPVVGLLADPTAIEDIAVLRWAHARLGIADDRTFLMLVGGVAVGIVVFANAFQALTLWLISRYTWSVFERLSVELFSKYLARPYVWFLVHNTAELRKNVLFEVERVTQNVLGPILTLAAFGLICVLLVGFLFWLDPLMAAIATLVLGGGYVLLFLAVRRFLFVAGKRRVTGDALRFKVVAEAFDGIKETKVLGRERFFVDRLSHASSLVGGSWAIQQVIGQVPRFGVEALAFGAVTAGVIYLANTGADLPSLVAVAGVYLFAGYRLLPAVQNIYQAVSTLRFNQAVLEAVYSDYSAFPTLASRSDDKRKSGERLDFEREFELRNVCFSYPGADKPTLKDVSITVKRGTSTALIGETGSGKTTIAGIMLGLLTPQSGLVLVDGAELASAERVRLWQNGIGYVPQDIFLADDTIAANIAFGVRPDQIDLNAVIRAARIANVHEFIELELAGGYETLVGERGVRLSGGQRQRIGIARALYHDPEVLVLDEATSDLDGTTELAVHDAIRNLTGVRTVILIAHRLGTTRHCDSILVVKKGKIIARGVYEELVAPNGLVRADVLARN